MSKETRTSRLKEILARKPAISDEERLARIRESVEGGTHVCPLCGFPSYTGGLHPFAGISGETKNQTQWCNGVSKIGPKDDPKRKPWRCGKCEQDWMYTQDEMNIADSDGLCHECVDV